MIEGDQGQHRRDHEHHDHHADHREQRREQLGQRLLQGLGDVVDVVGDPAQQLTARRAVEVGQRQSVDLALHLVAHPVDGPLHRRVQQVALPPQQQGADHVEPQRDQQDLAEQAEVDADPGGDVEALHQVGERVVALRAERGDRLLLGGPGRQLLADEAGEDHVGGPAEDPGADDAEHDAGHRQHDREDDHHPLGHQVSEQPLQGRSEVERLLHRDGGAGRPGPGRWCVLGAHRCLGQRGGLVVGAHHHIGRDEGLAGGGEVDEGIGDLAVGSTRVLAVGFTHAAASSALSWESTISA